MTNRNTTIIEQLRGRLKDFEGIADYLESAEVDTTIDGFHIDADFLLAMLEIENMFQSAALRVQRSIMRALGLDPDNPETTQSGKGKNDGGKKWSVEEILKHCTLEDNVIKLPNAQLNKKSYAEAKKWIEEAGGSWTGGRVQGFTFPFKAERVFSILHEGKRCNLQQEYQFFVTPDKVADRLVALVGDITPAMQILEPSAGTGAILNAVLRVCPDAFVDCYELMPENIERLEKIPQARLVGTDFTQSPPGKLYDVIVANPPFSMNQDIDHVRLMYERLATGGTLAAITSPHWEIGQERKCVDFRRWLEDIGAKTYDVEAGAFKDSGTSIASKIIVIAKS